MSEEAGEWLSQADYDLETAQAMFDSGRYMYTIFMCHLATEKALKALVVARKKEAPPRTHNLLLLMKICNASLTEEKIKFLASLNQAGVSTRYPENLHQSLEEYPNSVTSKYLNNTKETIACLKQQIS